MQLDPDVERVCSRVAKSTWRRVQCIHQSVFDGDDLRQEALLLGWTWQQGNQVELELGYFPNVVHHLAGAVAKRLIDRMRTINPMDRAGNRRLETYSLDREVSNNMHDSAESAHTLADLIEDPITPALFDRTEVLHDVDLALRTYPGPTRHAEVVYLHLAGITFAEIGAHFGVTESRACQIRTAFVSTMARDWTLARRTAEAA